MSKKHKIVLDVDGVLLNFIKRFEELVNEYKKNNKQMSFDFDETIYSLKDRYGLTKEEETHLLNEFAKKGNWSTLEPLDGVVDAVKLINQHFDIYVVTAIEEEFKEERLKNLKNIGVIPKEIHCVGVAGSKQDAVNKINPDVFIDDRLDHLHHANFVYHLAWLNDFIEQDKTKLKEDHGVDIVIHSLKEWADNHMPIIVEKLNLSKQEKIPLQRELRFY